MKYENLGESIIDCLRMFGPCTLWSIQSKLDLRGIVRSQMEILNECEFMLKRGLIKKASGFNDHAFKL